MDNSESEREEFIRAIRKFIQMKTLTKPLLNELIDHIDVYETEGSGKNRTQRVVIYYKFVGYLAVPERMDMPNYIADLREGVAVEYVSCEPIPEVTFAPDISAEARKEYAERVMARQKEKTEQA